MFPIAGISDASWEMELVLCEGSLDELLNGLQKEAGAAPLPLETLMFLLNGQGLDIHENVQFRDGDRLWVLPHISGG